MICKLKYLEQEVEFLLSFTKEKNVVFVEIENVLVIYFFKHHDQRYSYDGFIYKSKIPFASYGFKTKKDLLIDLQSLLEFYNDFSFQLENVFSISY